jgi:hypothetical protein
MFCNVKSIDEQEIEFEEDWRDHETEFFNLSEEWGRGNLLAPTLVGLTVIWEKVHVLKNYAQINNEDPDADEDANLFNWKQEQVKEPPIAKPRTQESKNFLANVREILHLWYEEKLKPKQIGRMFCIWPEKLNALVTHYVVNIEEKHWERVLIHDARIELRKFKADQVKNALI